MELGTLQGRLEVWKRNPSQSDRLAKAVATLDGIVSNPPMTNKDEDAEEFDKILRKAKARAKGVAALHGDKIPMVVHGKPVSLKPTEEEIEDSF